MKIRFQILDATGSVIGSSGDQPFELQPGDSRLPPKLVTAIFAMQTGTVQKVPLKAADAFGEIDPEKRFPLDPSGFKEKPQVGMSVQLQSKSGEPIQAKIIEVSDKGVIADANHPLAGKDLAFAVTVLEGGSAPTDSTQGSPPAAPPAPAAPATPPQVAKTAPATNMKIRFQILDATGSVIGSSGDQPFELQPGDSRLPPKLVTAIFAMQTGQVQKVPLKATDAFGEIDPEKRFPLDPSGFKEKPQVGMSVQLQSKSGEPLQAKIIEVSDKGVIADANHPLAGKDLAFAVTVLEGGSAPADSTQGSPPAAPPAPAAPPQVAKTAPATNMKIRFQILDATGSVIGSSGDQPFELQPGDSRLPPKLVTAIFAMQTGQVQKVPLKAADAFGEIDPEKRFPLDPSGFKEKPQVGMSVQLQSKSGEPLQAKIVEVSEKGVIADANHPLAGKDLAFAVTVLEGGSAPADSTQGSSSAAPSAPAAPTAPSPPADASQVTPGLPFIGPEVLRSDLDELPQTPPPPPQPGMETVGFLDTSGYNITGL